MTTETKTSARPSSINLIPECVPLANFFIRVTIAAIFIVLARAMRLVALVVRIASRR